MTDPSQAIIFPKSGRISIEIDGDKDENIPDFEINLNISSKYDFRYISVGYISIPSRRSRDPLVKETKDFSEEGIVLDYNKDGKLCGVEMLSSPDLMTTGKLDKYIMDRDDAELAGIVSTGMTAWSAVQLTLDNLNLAQKSIAEFLKENPDILLPPPPDEDDNEEEE